MFLIVAILITLHVVNLLIQYVINLLQMIKVITLNILETA
nr:MAG TPA: hypothetical protein [Bacteriophage sp.]